jgi:5'-methylthioadenosine phosphorylase
MKAFIAGTSMLSTPTFDSWKKTVIETPYGDVHLRKIAGYVFLQRHGTDKVPPHSINHLANVWALKSVKAREIVAINSAGSLQTRIKPGSFVIPHDFFSLCGAPTFFEKEMRFMVPRMDEDLAKRLYGACRRLDMNVTSGGIYIQTTGPRLETRAEINFFKKFGDIVGMTLASEATLCMEQGIPYASICSVDNYCNGVAKKPLTLAQMTGNAKKSVQAFERLINTLVRESGP